MILFAFKVKLERTSVLSGVNLVDPRGPFQFLALVGCPVG